MIDLSSKIARNIVILKMKIYHNPRCSKSRAALQYLVDSGLNFEIVEYLKTNLTAAEVKDLLIKLAIPARALLRSSEAVFKEHNLASLNYSEEQLISYMVKYPQLIERPIIVKDNEACIARPLENLERLIND